MIEELKTLLGPERLKRLADMPLVKEKLGLEGHLKAACEGAASPAQALIRAVRSAGGVPTAADVELLDAANNDAASKKAAEAKGAAELTTEPPKGGTTNSDGATSGRKK